MVHLDTRRHVTTHEVADMLRLVDAVDSATGHPALPDQSRLILQQGGGDCFAVVIGRDDDEIIAFAQLSPTNESWALDVVVTPDDRHLSVPIDELVTRALDALIAGGNVPADVTWWRSDHHHHHDDAAPHHDIEHDRDGGVHENLGFVLRRELLQLRRSLPTFTPVTIETRAFVPGADEQAFLDVNNRAFAGHPEQGGWTMESLRLRMGEPWFDPSGFRMFDHDGRVIGFCWTKVHPAMNGSSQRLGEIYVIAVDPDFGGKGLGSQLTLAGLAHLSDLGIDDAMLYVDADNHGAVSMYERLGFTVHASSSAFVRHLDAPATPLTAAEPTT